MKNNWIIGLPQGEREYKIGGVTYRVSSAFASGRSHHAGMLRTLY